MTTGMPELGSKISLVSKADIRYEGHLFTVDAQQCTIALASVRSFGTEDRETQYPVPAQSQVYDYILFRGSDIKDIRVVTNATTHAPLNDPAIMQLSVPQQPQFQSHSVLGQMGAQMNQFGGGPYANMGGIGGLNANLATSLGGGMQQRDPRTLTTNKPILDLIGGGSRCTTPASLGSRKSPTNDQGVQAGSSRRDDKKTVKPIQPPGQRNNQQQRRNSSRERRNSRGDGQAYLQGYQKNNHQMNRQNMNRPQNNHHQGAGGYQGQQRNNHHQHPQQQQQQQRGQWQNQGGRQRTNRQPRGPGGVGGGFKTNQGQTNQGPNKVKNTLKFDNDYDFEQANTEFEELRSQLAKVKLEEPNSNNSTTTPTAKPEVNGDVDKKDDSGNETGAGEPEQEEEPEVFYDKSKSFFDKISCEAVERAKGKSQRTDWRTERKLNSETFGVAATRRGNFRGRGAYRGGVSYRGGYRGGYNRQPQQRRDQQPQPQQQQQQVK